MNPYDELKDIFYQNIEEKCHGIYKQKAYFHSLQVSSLCQKLALENHLDVNIAGIMGLFHDYAQFINHSSFHHAKRSCEMIEPYCQGLNNEEKNIIMNAIENHSNKERIDDIYSEILKDADVLAQYFYEPDIIFNEASKNRLKKYLR